VIAVQKDSPLKTLAELKGKKFAFGDQNSTIGRYLAQFYEDGPEKQLLLSGQFKLLPTDYDWTLNSQEQQARKLAPPAAKP
jgi:hypothetical protein